MDVMFCLYAANIVIDPYFAVIPVKICSKQSMKGVSAEIYVSESLFLFDSCSDIFPGALMLCIFYTTIPSLPQFNSPALSRRHRLGCREMWKMN